MKLMANGKLRMSKAEELQGENQLKGFHNGCNVYKIIAEKKALGILK